MPITHFYDTPQDLLEGKPGDLLRHESFAGYTLPAGASAVRILYHSVDAGGRDVASSAAILIPAGKKPAQGWPIIVWAHGTSGVARQCAPSAMKDIYYGDEGLYDMLKAGFAVVATDYHGLGTEGPHQYIDKIAQANDVVYAVPAAQEAVPSLGRQWVVDGHSQGGLAAWGVAEAEARLKDSSYLGAVSVAGATHLAWQVNHLNEDNGAGFYLVWWAYGIHARFPEFKPDEMLTTIGAAHYREVTTQGCWLYGYASYLHVDAPKMVKADWAKSLWVRKFFDENRVGDAPIAGPIFVIAGESDTAVPFAATRDLIDRACKNRQNVQFRSYPGLDHDPTMVNSTPDQIAWIKDRFGGIPATGNCPPS
ncbi:MAG TPA: lipase family protein [Steroidobacteraceae bacterium]|nr:lipase family protein [Steroidobacteraceae bacterium]